LNFFFLSALFTCDLYQGLGVWAAMKGRNILPKAPWDILLKSLRAFGHSTALDGRPSDRLFQVEGHGQEMKLDLRFEPPQVAGPAKAVAAFEGPKALFHHVPKLADERDSILFIITGRTRNLPKNRTDQLSATIPLPG